MTEKLNRQNYQFELFVRNSDKDKGEFLNRSKLLDKAGRSLICISSNSNEWNEKITQNITAQLHESVERNKKNFPNSDIKIQLNVNLKIILDEDIDFNRLSNGGFGIFCIYNLGEILRNLNTNTNLNSSFIFKNLSVKFDKFNDSLETTKKTSPTSQHKLIELFERLKKIFVNAHSSQYLSDISTFGPTLIEGNIGVGKTSLIERWALKNEKEVVTLNLSSIPEGLIASELFGHKKGSFTGATENTLGKIKQADNKVLFIDEFQNAPAFVQVQLLTAIDQSNNIIKARQIGGEEFASNVKLIISINETLDQLIDAKTFRMDFLSRIPNRVFVESLTETLNRETEIEIYLSTLLWINFISLTWRNQHAVFEQLNISKTFSPIFNDKNIIDSFKLFDWQNNFNQRSFVILSNYIFEELKSSNFPSLSEEIIFHCFQNLSKNFSITRLPTKSRTITKSSNLALISNLIKKENGNVRKIISNYKPQLSRIKLSTETSLWKYIKINYEYFDSKVIELIEKRKKNRA